MCVCGRERKQKTERESTEERERGRWTDRNCVREMHGNRLKEDQRVRPCVREIERGREREIELGREEKESERERERKRKRAGEKESE